MNDLAEYARECLLGTHLSEKDGDIDLLTLAQLKETINDNELYADPQERARLIDQAIAVLHGNYVFTHHHAIAKQFDPIAMLLHLRSRLVDPNEASGGTDNWTFFKIVTRVMAEIGDPHTAVQLPDEAASYTGFVPFLIEGYFDPSINKNRYFISHVVEGADLPNVAVGDEVLALNGQAVDERLEADVSTVNGLFEPRLRFGRRNLDQLTIVPLSITLVDDENVQSLTLTLQHGNETVEHKHAYLFTQLGLETSGTNEERDNDDRRYHGDVRAALFAPRSAKEKSAARDGRLSRETIDSRTNLRVEEISLGDGEHSGKRVCYVRLFALESGNRDQFIEDVVAPLEARRTDFAGLIIDVRSCKGGSIRIADQLTARCAGRETERVKGQLRNTRLNEAYCRQRAKKIKAYGAWADSIRARAAEGLMYSAALPFGDSARVQPPESAAGNNGIPKLMIVDRNTASAAEVLAAGFADHGLGEILGVDPATAGACSHGIRLNKLLMERVNGGAYPYDRESTIGRIRLSLCRLVRSGRNAGEVIEGKGVRADLTVPLTKSDVMDGNRNLLTTAIERLMSTSESRPERGPVEAA